MFYNCFNLKSLDKSKFITSKFNEFSDMFYNCKGLYELDFKFLDISLIILISNMFYSCSGLTTIDFTSFLLNQEIVSPRHIGQKKI